MEEGKNGDGRGCGLGRMEAGRRGSDAAACGKISRSLPPTTLCGLCLASLAYKNLLAPSVESRPPIATPVPSATPLGACSLTSSGAPTIATEVANTPAATV